MKENWWKSRRVWSGIIMAASAVSLILVQADVITSSVHVQIGQIIGCLAGTFGVSASWMKPKTLKKSKKRRK